MSSGTNLRHKLSKKLKVAVSSSKNSVRTRNAGSSVDKVKTNGSEGKIRKKVKTYEIQPSEEGSDWEFNERKSSKILNARNKRVYAKETDENRRLHNGTGASKKKGFSKKGENKMNDEFGKGKKSDRTMWVSKAKHTSSNVQDDKDNAKLSNTKHRVKAKEAGTIESVKTDDNGNGLLKKRKEQKSELSKWRSQKVVTPSNSTKRNARERTGLDNDSEILDEQPKKKKRVIRIDPYDISNKRLDDDTLLDGRVKEKKKGLEEKPEMSKNAQFRAIQPSPSILSFVEDNLLGRRRLIELRRAGYNIDLSAPLDNIPNSNSTEREKIEENLFRNKLEFFAAAKVSSSFPPPNLPEIAFAGRSNVGKSSLLNALTRQWGVVRISDKPGLTQTINFFKLGSKLSLVDLPGYGFAYAKDEVKEAWEELVKEYVSTRVGLKRVCLLIDTKWGMKPRDYELVELMEKSQTKYQIVLTKTDVVFPIDVARRAMQIEERLKQNKAVVQPVMMVSSKSGAGIRSLRTVLAKIARFAKH